MLNLLQNYDTSFLVKILLLYTIQYTTTTSYLNYLLYYYYSTSSRYTNTQVVKHLMVQTLYESLYA